MSRTGIITTNLKVLRILECSCDVEADLPTVMFRLKQTKPDALNYHRFLLARNAAGEVVADDIYVFLSGENMSESIRRAWLPTARQSMKTDI